MVIVTTNVVLAAVDRWTVDNHSDGLWLVVVSLETFQQTDAMLTEGKGASDGAFMTIAISHTKKCFTFLPDTHLPCSEYQVVASSTVACWIVKVYTRRNTFSLSLLAAAVLRARQMNRLNSRLPWLMSHLTTTTESSSSSWDTVQAQKFLSTLKIVSSQQSITWSAIF